MRLVCRPIPVACLGLLALLCVRTSPAQIVVPDHFATIQAAVDASSPGGRILIRTGTYVEQVVVSNKSLTLRGEPGATIQAPAGMVQTLQPFTGRRPILSVLNAKVRLQGLAFDGRQSGLANPELSGVYYLAASGSILGCSVTGVRRAAPTAGQQPSAIHVSNPEDAGPQVQEVLIAGNTVEDSEIGILVKGDVETIPATFDPNAFRLTATIQNNRVVGPTAFASNSLGIFSEWGSRTVIVQNDVSGFLGASPAGSAVAILIGLPFPVPFRHPHSVVAFNNVSDSTNGILALFADRCHIGANVVVAGPASFGGIGVSGDNNVVGHNLVDMRASGFDIGIVMFGLESGGPGFALGRAVGTSVIANTIAGASLPIIEETGTSGTRLIANRILP